MAPSKKSMGSMRRVWSSREENVLLLALKELVAQGQKSDNGFRTGYLPKLENAMKKAFPLTDIIANPNITSKITTWKKSYGSIVTANAVSGVGFNTVTSQLECTDEQWVEILRKDPSMRGMRYKEWTLYPDWVEIFGKDRATGSRAEDVCDAAKKTKRAEHTPTVNTTFEGNGENFDVDGLPNTYKAPNNPIDENDEISTGYTTKSAPTPTSAEHKKRKINPNNSDNLLAQTLENFCKTTGERLETIAKRIGYDHDLGVARKQLFAELGNIAGLTISNRLTVAKIIGSKVEHLELWMGLPEDARAVFVTEILTQDGN